MKRIIGFFFPSWKTIYSKPVEMTMESLIFRREWKEDGVLVIQESIDGRKRAYIQGLNGKESVDIDYVRAFIDV